MDHEQRLYTLSCRRFRLIRQFVFNAAVDMQWNAVIFGDIRGCVADGIIDGTAGTNTDVSANPVGIEAHKVH